MGMASSHPRHKPYRRWGCYCISEIRLGPWLQPKGSRATEGKAAVPRANISEGHNVRKALSLAIILTALSHMAGPLALGALIAGWVAARVWR